MDRTKASDPGDGDPAAHRLLIDDVESIFWLFDWRERHLYLNAAYETVTGRSRDPLREKPDAWWECVDPAHREALASDIAGCGRFERTVRIFRPDGEQRWVRLRGFPVHDDAGRVAHLAGIGDDITERRAHGKTARAAQDAYRMLAENVSDLITRHDLTGRVLYASPSMQAVLGYTPEDAVGASPSVWLGSRAFQAMKAHGARLLRSGEPERFELCVRHRDGSERWLQSSCRTLRDEAGRPMEILAVSRDVTEQRRAAAALTESEERFRQLAENIHQVFWLVDCERQQVVYVSPAYEAIWGHEPEAIHDQSHRWTESIHPEDRERVWRSFAEKAERGEFDVEYRVLRPDGEVRWIHDRGFPIRNAQGRVYRIAGIAEDVTEVHRARQALRESEERFGQLVENLGGMFWLCDWETGRMIYRAGELEGLQAMAGLDGDPKSWLRHVHPADRGHTVQSLARLSAEGSFEASYRAFREDGEIRWVRSRGFVVRDERGKPVRAAGSSEDVTERRLLEARVQQTQKLESLGVLAGGIAHDFNNLLTGILGNASLALDRLPDDALSRVMVEEIEAAARRAAGLCSQMLAYAGRTTLSLEAVDLNEVVRGIVPLLRTSLRGAAVTMALEDGVPAIRGDASQLGQIVLNLLTNAAESFNGGSGPIRVTTDRCFADAATLRESYLKEELPAGEYVVLEVSDAGCGMGLDTQRQIFEPFFTTKFTGRGLGLAAVLGIVRSHGGAVFLDSELGRGTTFRLLFPATASAHGPSETRRPAEVPRRKETILVIDDEELVLNVIARILEGAGHRVLCASSGDAGLALYRQHAGDVAAVLLDLTMPGRSGEEVLTELRGTARDLPVVLMSGFTEAELGDRIGALGYSRFVHKPFRGPDLLAELGTALADSEGPNGPRNRR